MNKYNYIIRNTRAAQNTKNLTLVSDEVEDTIVRTYEISCLITKSKKNVPPCWNSKLSFQCKNSHRGSW